MQQYKDVLKDVLENGFYRPNPHNPDNTDEASLGLPGLRMSFDLRNGQLPLITLRSLQGSWKPLVEELLWFLSGSTNVRDLQARGVRFWDAWEGPDTSEAYGYSGGELGPIYGHQWRNFGATRNLNGTYQSNGFDQIAQLVEDLTERPDSKRHMVTTWNPIDANAVFIAPCHGIFKCFVANGELTLMMFQRSADLPVGVPFNIASYSLLTHMLAQVTGLKAREFIHFLGDAHIYMNQVDNVRELLKREPRPSPRIVLDPEVSSIFDFHFGDFTLLDYDPHPAVKGIPVAT